MRLLAPALLLLLQEPLQDPKPVFKRAMALRNNGHEALPAGLQVVVRITGRKDAAEEASDVALFHHGKRLAVWAKGLDVWFRLPVPIAEGAIDAGFELRHGGGRVQGRPREIFEFFDEPAGVAPDPKHWDVDPRLNLKSRSHRTAVTGIAAKVSEYEPASLILKDPRLTDAFVTDIDLLWDVTEKSVFNFAMRVEVEDPVKVPEEIRKRCADLLAKLASDDIESRDEAAKDLIKVGRPAVPQLESFIRTKEGDRQAFATALLARIEQDFPPPVIRSGFSVDDKPGDAIRQTYRLGNSRGELEGRLIRKGGGFISVERKADGATVLDSFGLHPAKARIAGTVGRIRFDFWGVPGGEIGAVWISRVLIRRPAPSMPEALFGRDVRLP